MLLALAAPCLIHPQSTNEGSQRDIPVLQSTCLITADVRRLVEFYEPLLNRKASYRNVVRLCVSHKPSLMHTLPYYPHN